MRTDVERVLSARLHAEAVDLVPDSAARPFPDQRSAASARLGGRRQRWWSGWRAPALAAAAVMAVALVTVAVVQAHRDNRTTAAPNRIAASGVSQSPAASFDCAGMATEHAAHTEVAVIGVTERAFCAGQAGTQLQPSGPLRALLWTDLLAAGVADGSVDAIVWEPSGGDRVGVDLVALGTLRGFAFPLETGVGGSLVLYSGSVVVAREKIDEPGVVTATSSSAADPQRAERSYPAGQGPTPRPGAWPTNARGQTYGSAGEANAETGTPDLVSVVATNGKEGYALRTDLEGPMPTSISDATALNSAPSRTIPVFESDGVTKIGEFVVG